MEKWKIYIGEIQTQIEFAKYAYLSFQKASTEDDVKGVFFNLHHFVVHTSNIDKILDFKPNSKRHQILASHIDLADINLKSFRRLRNHLEHFDERLDRWVNDYDGFAFFDMNIITGAKGFPEKAFLRALDGNTFKFYGEDYDMVELYNTILAIESRLSMTRSS